MACCGDRRAQLTRGLRTVQTAASAPPVSGERTALRYVGPVPMVLRGTASGEIYRLTEAGALTQVDPRDAAALVRTRWFRS